MYLYKQRKKEFLISYIHEKFTVEFSVTLVLSFSTRIP